MDEVYLRIPRGRLQVPAKQFAASLSALAQRLRVDPRDRYAAGALACGQWIADLTARHPVTGVSEPCTVERLASCQMAAAAVVYGWAWAPSGVDSTWATGVLAMASWARGAARRPPIAESARRAA